MKKAFITATAFIAITLLYLSCGSAKSAEPIEILTGTTWQLSSVNNKNADEINFGKAVPVISFTTDNKVTGNGGCNNFSGSYNLNDEGGISISQLISTKMACGDGNGENEFLTTLTTANMTKINNDKLILMKGIDEIMVFVPKEY